MKTLKEIAEKYIGITEVSGNNGWYNSNFETKMITLGWQSKQAWCMYFVQLCVEEYLSQFDSGLIERYRKCFSPSAVTTFRNFSKNYPELISTKPTDNSILIFQRYNNNNANWRGHGCIVSHITDNDSINTIDGNTSNVDRREGDCVGRNVWNLDWDKETGLRPMGFINLPTW